MFFAEQTYWRTDARAGTLIPWAVAAVIASYASIVGRPAGGPWLVTGLVTVMWALLWVLRWRPRLASVIALSFLQLVLVAGLSTFGPVAGAGAVATISVLLCAIEFGATLSFAAAAQATLVFIVVGALVHGRAGGAYHARKARRWVSCPPQLLPPKTVSTADIPCPKVQFIQSERPARSWRGPSLGFWGTCAIVRWSQPRVWRFALCVEYLFAIVQRIA